MKAKLFFLKDRIHLKDSICNCHGRCYTTERKKKPTRNPWELPISRAAFRAQRRDCNEHRLGERHKKRKRNCHAEGSRDHNGLDRSDVDNQDSSQSWPPRQTEQSGQKDLCVRDKLEPKGSRWLCERVSEGQKAPSQLAAARKDGQNPSGRESILLPTRRTRAHQKPFKVVCERAGKGVDSAPTSCPSRLLHDLTVAKLLQPKLKSLDMYVNTIV